jgi:nitrogen fixation protein FixH
LAGLAIEAALRRPVDAELDRPLAFQDLGHGHYRARVGALREGQWQIRARAHDRAGRALDFERSFEWRTTS